MRAFFSFTAVDIGCLCRGGGSRCTYAFVRVRLFCWLVLAIFLYSLHNFCVLTQEETGASPLITPFGVHCLEKLGDTLLKNGEVYIYCTVPCPQCVTNFFVRYCGRLLVVLFVLLYLVHTSEQQRRVTVAVALFVSNGCISSC